MQRLREHVTALLGYGVPDWKIAQTIDLSVSAIRHIERGRLPAGLEHAADEMREKLVDVFKHKTFITQ